MFHKKLAFERKIDDRERISNGFLNRYYLQKLSRHKNHI